VLAKVNADRSPLPKMPTWARQAVVWGTLTGSAAIAWGLGGGPRSVLDPAGGLLAASIGAPVALRPLHRRRPRWEGVRVAGALALPLAIGLLPPVSGPATVAVVVGGVGCFLRGMVVAALVLAVLGATDRRTVGSMPSWLGGAAVAGGAATAALALWCPAEATVHRVVAHGTPGVVAAALVGGALALWRSARRAR
jgi:hypothetical protein